MLKLLITVFAMSAVVLADPAVILSGGLVSSPLTSAALVAPATSPVVAPVSPISQVASISPYSPIAPVAPLAPLTQVLSDYKYAYGSSYSYQDYFPVVNSALSLPSLPYSLPYAYAADWYYRK